MCVHHLPKKQKLYIPKSFAMKLLLHETYEVIP